MVINNHHHTREEQKQTTHDDTTLRPPRAPLWSPFASLARDAFGLCGEIRIEILSFAWNENEEFEIRGPPGPLRRPCPPRMPASEGAERAVTATNTHNEPLRPKTGAERARTATPHRRTVGTGTPAVVPRLERAKIRSGARTRGTGRRGTHGALRSRRHTSTALS
jgi:hypothetical protein